MCLCARLSVKKSRRWSLCCVCVCYAVSQEESVCQAVSQEEREAELMLCVCVLGCQSRGAGGGACAVYMCARLSVKRNGRRSLCCVSVC